MKASPIQVSLADIRAALDVIFTDLQERRGASVDLHVDYFWSVPFDEIYDMGATPTRLTVGQISESVEYIENLASGEQDPFDHALVWLSDVLRAIALDPIVEHQWESDQP